MNYICQREGVLRECLRGRFIPGNFIPGKIFRSQFFREKKFLRNLFSGTKIPNFLRNIIPGQEYGFPFFFLIFPRKIGLILTLFFVVFGIKT